MKLTSREKNLLMTFGVLLTICVGGGLVWTGVQWLQSLFQENEELTRRVAELQSAVDNRAIWEQRDQWLNQHTETFRTREDASAALLGQIEASASEAGMELKGREIIGANPDSAAEGEEAESPAYFHTATIRVKVSGSQEKVLSWVHCLQQPEKLIGVSGEVIDAGEEFTAEIDITKSYFEGEN